MPSRIHQFKGTKCEDPALSHTPGPRTYHSHSVSFSLGHIKRMPWGLQRIQGEVRSGTVLTCEHCEPGARQAREDEDKKRGAATSSNPMRAITQESMAYRQRCID